MTEASLLFVLVGIALFSGPIGSGSLTLLGSVIRQEYRPMLSALAVVSILMLFAAGAIYLLEREGQPETFGDLPSYL